jgi:hypothetical protein
MPRYRRGGKAFNTEGTEDTEEEKKRKGVDGGIVTRSVLRPYLNRACDGELG